jgi:peroxiredoxin
MTRFLAALAVALFAQAVPAQPASATLDATLRDFENRRRALMQSGDATLEKMRTLHEELARALEQLVGKAPKGPERVETRLALADAWAHLGDAGKAKAALAQLEPAGATLVQLARGAEMAGRLGMSDERAAWIDAAVGREAPVEERAELAKLLVTRLQEIDKGEAIFAQMHLKAANDEERARAAWLRAGATREREDLEEGAYDRALEELAAKYPNTYFGGVARDRNLARGLKRGSPAIPLRLTDVAGKPVTLDDYKGKVLLLDFWSAAVAPSRRIEARLARLHQQLHEKGFDVLSVSVDADCKAEAEAAAKDGMRWRRVCDGKGYGTDAALRYGVETVPWMLLIGRDGKVAKTNLFPVEDHGFQELEAAVTAALSAGQ